MRLDSDELRTFAVDLLGGLGAPPATAGTVADSLIRADLAGFGTHGIAILPLYREMIEDDAIDPTVDPVTEQRAESWAAVDGRDAFGQLTGREATARGVAIAEERGTAVVAIRNGSHLGPIGEYAERAAAQGMIFLGFANTGGGAKNTAPFGGQDRKLSTNPVAFGFPTFDALPFDIVSDFATSQISGSIVRDRHRAGKPLHDEWTTSQSGDPVTDPASFLEGEGAILPLGGRVTGHKGYGLSIAAELLGGLVGGGAVVGERDPTWLANGAAFVVIDPRTFVSRTVIEQRVESLASHLRSDEVRLPGEGTHQRRSEHCEQGVEVAAADLTPLAELASTLSVDIPAWLQMTLSDAEDTDDADDLQTW